jgi:hypothetical protein
MRFVQELCSICNQNLAMPVVQEEDAHSGLIWVQCPICKEIKPLDLGTRPNPGLIDPAAAEVEARSGTGARRVVRHYRSGERFRQGEWIYHPEWDDTGEVMETLRSKGGREVIVVAFEKCGTKRLVVNFVR